MATENKVYKHILDNGLTILVRESHTIPKVSIQLWYNVGSKDEKTNEKGIAHLIEHMIFKGTNRLSESDINMITQKLSGVCNAFTSYDYTGYLFDFPSHHWKEALPIMADCMTNCSFKQDLLNSEMKAVIQELKMYRDNYSSSLIEHMISTIFNDHPYHYPIIGFKQDLWDLKRERLVSFYKKHYHPNNATLVVVGNVDTHDVFDTAKKYFGSIPAQPNYKKEMYVHKTDLVTTTTTLYRDIKVPYVALSFVIPGAHAKQDYFTNILSWIVGSGKQSRLQKKIVNELQLATQLESFVYDLFDYGLFFIYFQPKEAHLTDSIITIIQEELESIVLHGLTQDEIIRAAKQVESDNFDVLEDNQKQAYAIGQSFLATGDENYLFTYLQQPFDTIAPIVTQLVKDYFKPCLMHRGNLLPIAEKDKHLWLNIQQESDQEDNRVLSVITREKAVEEGVLVHTIPIQEPIKFHFPQPSVVTLPNGLTILFYHNPNIPKVDLLLTLKAKSYYDPESQQGLINFMSNMLIEGTKNYSAAQLAQEIESRGMIFDARPGSISMSMLNQDLAEGLTLLKEVLINAIFPEDQIQKVRHQIMTEIDHFWDTPTSFIAYLARKEIYKNHPYSKLAIGTQDYIQSVTQQDLIKAYQAYITPDGASLAIVGDLQHYNIQDLVSNILGDWTGNKIVDISFPAIAPLTSHVVNHFINRDQTVLAFAGLSINREDKDFDKLLIFDQIFTGGVLGSMSSRLFELRERSGLFYTIGGSLLTLADEQPGIVFIRTIVSNDRLQEAERQILATITDAGGSISDDEYISAQNALLNTLVDRFESNRRIAATFAFLHRFNLPLNYFDSRAAQLAKITKSDIQETVRRILDPKKMITLHAGRIE